MEVNFSGGPIVKNSPTNTGVRGLIPGAGRFHMWRGGGISQVQAKTFRRAWIHTCQGEVMIEVHLAGATTEQKGSGSWKVTLHEWHR